MSTELSEQARERLSGLVDGEGSHEDLQQLLADGRASRESWSGTLEAWHSYQLIGDVMRSEELAGRGRDDVFLARLRERLADEPVVMAPAPLLADLPARAEQQAAQAAREHVRRRSWRAPLAAAAGVMVVAGVAALTGLPGQQGGALQPGPTLVQAPAVAAPGAEQRILTANGALLRDSRLDQYLSAHKQFGGSSALGVPSGFLRSATYEGPSH